MKKVQVEVVGIFADQLSNHPQETRFTLLMGEIQGDRKLPIMIGLIEAQSIALALEGTTLERPLMHDLFKEAVLKLDFIVQETVIAGLKDDVFFADLYLTSNTHTYVLDSRPSDAIAISLRLGAPIFVYEELLKQVGKVLIKKFETADLEEGSLMVKDPSLQNLRDNDTINFEDYSVDALQELLAWVVNREEYEKAALIRDELNKRK